MREMFALLIVIFSVGVFGHHMRVESRTVPVTYSIEEPKREIETPPPPTTERKLAECVSACAMMVQTANGAAKCARGCALVLAPEREKEIGQAAHDRKLHPCKPLKMKQPLKMKHHPLKMKSKHHHSKPHHKKFHSTRLTVSPLRC